MPEVGLEPTHLSILHFECSASANSATRARITGKFAVHISVSNAIRSQHAELLYMQIGCFKESGALMQQLMQQEPAINESTLRWT